jgi:hypothetical protein
VTHYLRIVRSAATGLLFLLAAAAVQAQAPDTKPKPNEESADKSTKTGKTFEKPSFPFHIQLLETNIRFEANGNSRKEVHTIVKLNDALGVREFARLTFDYNRSFQQVEIPMMRITHRNGGTSDVLPSAMTDVPNPAVEKYPAYQDVRVKAVRILGLQEGDTIEYRVTTTTTRAPMGPDFWLEHAFDRSGQVLKEIYQVDWPKTREVRLRTTPEIVESSAQTAKDTERISHRWEIDSSVWGKNGKTAGQQGFDVVLTTYQSWGELSSRLNDCVQIAFGTSIWPDAMRKIGVPREPVNARALYGFVSSKIATVDLPFALSDCPFPAAAKTLSNGYGSPQDKATLLVALLAQRSSDKPSGSGWVHFYTNAESPEAELPRPSLLSGVLVSYTKGKHTIFLDPGLEVAPYGMIPAELRGKKVIGMHADCKDSDCWKTILNELPFASVQKVDVEGSIDKDGKLKTKVKYTLRGDNELLLRVAFHKTTKDKWKDVAGLLALSDGFRGVVSNVTASDPMATKDPFTVEYELTQEKFVDWSKKPVRIPALLPQIGLPDTLAKTSKGNIELGTPLDVETQMTLQLPAGTTVQTPAGTAVERDYATYSSKYALNGETLSATRHIHFLRREVAADRAVDYNAFAQAVQNDQSQYFVLDRAAGTKSAAAE